MQPRRIAMFVLLGLFLVWLTIFAWHVPRLLRVPDSRALAFFMMALVIVFAIGLIPALVLAGTDEVMARLGLARPLRAAVCAVLETMAGVKRGNAKPRAKRT